MPRRSITAALSAASFLLAACADLQPRRIEVQPEWFRPDLTRADTAHVGEHRDAALSTFERPSGYFYAFWYETPGPVPEVDAPVPVRALPISAPAAQPVKPKPQPLPAVVAKGPAWADSPAALADPNLSVWARWCDGKPLEIDEYKIVERQPIPDYADPCYPPK